MKKVVIYIIPILTLCLGYAIRWFSESPTDTIVKEKLVYQKAPISQNEKMDVSNDGRPELEQQEDSEVKVEEPILDDSLSLSDSIIEIDSTDIFTDSIQIKRDRVLRKSWVSVKKIEKPLTNIDSLKTEGMGIRKVGFSDKILIEFWESPFNFTGYKLSKSKLIVYGLDPNTNYFLRDRNNDTLELNSSDDSFNFVFTDDFRPLEPNLRDSL